MKHSSEANRAAAVTRSKGKMYEYNVPSEAHIAIPSDLVVEELFPLAIGTLGDYAAEVARKKLLDIIVTHTDSDEVRFSATVLHAYVESRLNDELTSDLLILSSCAYYLCEMPGNSIVLYRDLDNRTLETSSISEALRWSLGAPWTNRVPLIDHSTIGSLIALMREFYKNGSGIATIYEAIKKIRSQAYSDGDPKSLLYADLLAAISIARIERSSWSLLPKYSGLSPSNWAAYLSKSDSVKELWPSQQVLGEMGLYSGSSAVVQMPTSAGKTRAMELVIRSAIISDRSKLIVFVAPYKALCQEITISLNKTFVGEEVQVNQLSDAIQKDYVDELAEILNIQIHTQPHIIVVTPEKLLYILRQKPELVAKIGLVIYDEGHQFDTGKRGVIYELLLTSIRSLLKSTAQTILISAVLKNANQLAAWLLNDADAVVFDDKSQTRRAYAFASWISSSGQLHFYDEPNANEAFFVPRVLVKQTIRKKGSNRGGISFPDRESSSSIALYLALRLVGNGSIAIFCGTKPMVATILKDIVDVFERTITFPTPASISDTNELHRLEFLHGQHFGTFSYLTEAARLGAFGHYSSTPHGLRLAIEHAMRENLVHLVVCTSTLAQGVNLPIRYLLVTGTNQGDATISTRDFKNLMGRAGRAGMHGEGTVIFTDPTLFDKRLSRKDKKRWTDLQDLLTLNGEAATGSTLLNLVKPIYNVRKTATLNNSPASLIKDLLHDRESVIKKAENISSKLQEKGFTPKNLIAQLKSRCDIIDAVQSFLMANRQDKGPEKFFEIARNLAKRTFAFSIAKGDQADELVKAFEEIAKNIEANVPDVDEQARFGKTLLGVDVSLEVNQWVEENITMALLCDNEEELLEFLWPIFEKLASEKRFHDVEPADSMKRLALAWISGMSFENLHNQLRRYNASYPFGKARRTLTIEMTVELCERGCGFDLAFLLAAIMEATAVHLAWHAEECERVTKLMGALQKRLKYGLSTPRSITIYESGFADRVVAQAIDAEIPKSVSFTSNPRDYLFEYTEGVEQVLLRYPQYFWSVYQTLSGTGSTSE